MEKARFIHTGVGEERSVDRLKHQAISHFGKVDIVINNATVVPLGATWEVPVGDWDTSYRVNLRDPVHLGDTLDAEMQETGISAVTIGPGFVPTRTAVDSITWLTAGR